jgi:general stress protein YciG
MKKPKMPPAVLEFFKATGSQGGKARAERHTPEELREWGKKGGRPKGTKDAKPRMRKDK